MSINWKILLSLLFITSSTGLFGQGTLVKKQKKIKILPVPTFGYEPETKTHIGAVSLFTLDFYQDSMTRTSNAKVEFNYTWMNQIILESEWDYFFKEESWFTNGRLHFSKYPDYYWGIGNQSSEEQQLLFSTNRTIFDINGYKNLGHKVFVGIGTRYLNYKHLSSDSINPFQELRSSSVFGLRLAGFKDTRNNLLNASTGMYYFTEIDYNFSQSNYLRFTFDARNYFSISDKYVFAFRLYNAFNLNTPNFYDYSILGGDDYVRGYFYGRFRDKNLSTLQAEIRVPIIWRIGLAFIGGASSIYNDFSSIQNIRPNYGGGLRILIDKEDDVNLRFDYVLGSKGHSGFYVSFGESF